MRSSQPNRVHKSQRKRRPKQKPVPVQALATIQPAQLLPAPVAQISVIPSIKETIGKLETVRRFISKGLNQGLQRAEKKAKLAGKTLTEFERKRLEIDYGTIPGVNKPFLLQPGAEKIAMWLHLRPEYVKVEHTLGESAGHIEVVARCKLMSTATKEELFQGPECSCSTMESNYRFRWVTAEPQPTTAWIFAEGKVAKARGEGKSVKEYKKNEWTGRWLWQDRINNPNIYDERNKVRQMAEKRAIVKAIRNYGALSEIFTEDPTEWAFPDEDGGETPETPPTGKVVKSSSSATAAEGDSGPGASPAPSTVPPKIVSVSWASDAAEVAHVFGDITEALPIIKGQCHGIKLEGKDVYVVPAPMIPDLERWCRENQHGFQEVSGLPKKASPEAAVPSGGPSPSNGPESGHSGPTAVSGMLKMLRAGKSKNKNVESYQALIGEAGSGVGFWYYAYNANLFPILSQAQNKPVEVLLKDKVIIGFVKVNGRAFESDGITPIIQNSEDRPKPGNLFK